MKGENVFVFSIIIASKPSIVPGISVCSINIFPTNECVVFLEPGTGLKVLDRFAE